MTYYHLRTAQEMRTLFGHVRGRLRTRSGSPIAARWTSASRATTCLTSRCPRAHLSTPTSASSASWAWSSAFDANALMILSSDRLDHELAIIHQMGFDAYFLIVWDLCRFARQEGIWYNAQGFSLPDRWWLTV